MEKEMFQVCELEEEIRGVYEFTVSAVPETWIVELEDGSYICYWPKKNAAKKIRQLVRPKLDGSWSTYKCRVLMNGEKFATYKEAKEAEKIGENFSSMNFDVTGVDEEISEENVDPKKIKYTSVRACAMNFDVSDAGDGEINEENVDPKKIKYSSVRACVSKEAMNFKVDDLDTPNIYLLNNDTEELMSEKSDYSSDFQSKNTNFLTSTLLDEPKCDVETILSKISTMQKDLHELKEMVSKMNVEKPTSQHVSVPVQSPVRSTPVQSPARSTSVQSPVQISNAKYQMKEETVHRSKVEIISNITLKVPDSIHQETPIDKDFSELVDFPKFNHSNDALNDLIPTEEDTRNHTFVISPKQKFELPNTQVDNGNHAIDVLQDLIPTEDDYCNQTFVNAPKEAFTLPSTAVRVNNLNAPIQTKEPIRNQKPLLKLPILSPDHKPVLKLPILSPDHYEHTEVLLEEHEHLEVALTTHLLPFKDEEESAYMKRTILLVFRPDFFLDSTSWKREKNRVNIKNSYLVKCWQESHGTKFEPDEKYAKFMKHFRRIKSAMRAAEKKGTIGQNVK